MTHKSGYKNPSSLIFLLFAGLLLNGCNQNKDGLSRYNVVWTSPGDDSFGSMPLGNGDIGMNVWMEKNGDLVFYISKVDAFDAWHQLPKLGRIRIKMDPVPDLSDFRQTLNLADASILIESGGTRFRIWVDANHPVIRVEGSFSKPGKAAISLETIRPLTSSGVPLPETGTAGILFDDRQDRLAWCYRNQSSVWMEAATKQNSREFLERVQDPLMHRTSGCVVRAEGFTRSSANSLESGREIRSIDCSITVNSSQPESPEAWLAGMPDPVYDWEAHAAWWKEFWERSHIHVTSCGKGKIKLQQARFTNAAGDSLIYGGLKEIDADVNAFQISQRYALERFCQIAAGRGQVPPPFNGSIFTMDMPAGTHVFIDKGTRKSDVNADNRDWNGLPFFWQNTRHPCWSMLARGDYDALLAVFRFIRGTLEISMDRTRLLFGHDGAYMTEGIFWKGVSVFTDLPQHLKYHYLGTLEMTAMMCDYFDHTVDQQFAKEILIRCATEFIRFYEMHYPDRDDSGKIVIKPAGVAETYQPVTNPVTEVSALRYILSRLVSYDEDLFGKERTENWRKLLAAMPDFPRRTIRGMELLAPGWEYSGRLICETPELYAIWPFRQADLSNRDFLPNARQSFHVRQLSLDGTPDNQSWETGGWQSAPIWAASLGLAREAARLTSINFNDRFANFTYENADIAPPVPDHPKARFPAFWETKMDYTPDNDHGGVSANALQSMLIQEIGGKIYLLPAWPEDWDVSFKLHASGNTTVECEYKDGKVHFLKVIPESRRSDILDMSTLQQRIRTLVEVALADRNYLFGLPPMLDAQLIAGPVTGEWISRYGHTLEGCRAGPWQNSVFKGNTVFVHILDWPGEGVRLPDIPLGLVSSESITGQVTIQRDDQGFRLNGTPDPLNTIVKLDFDGEIEDIIRAKISEGSLTAGKCRSESIGPDGRLTAAVDLGSVQSISRIEITIENPDHVRGRYRGFELHAGMGNGKWEPVYRGRIYGTIFSMRIDPITASAVRLVVDAKSVRGLDVW